MLLNYEIQLNSFIFFDNVNTFRKNITFNECKSIFLFIIKYAFIINYYLILKIKK